MSCTAVDYLYAAVIATFVIAGVVAAWWHSSLTKLLQLRHPSTHELLGRPYPPRTAESDRHTVAMLRFILAGQYRQLNDEVVARHARVLRACAVLSTAAILALAVIILAASSPEAMLSMRCWRG